MNNLSLKDLLLAYSSNDHNEMDCKARMLDFLEKYGSAAFDPATEEGHFTGSCWLLDISGNQALLTHHAKIGKWLQLGGHCDCQADILAVAVREAQEESGITKIVPVQTSIFDIDVHVIPTYKSTPAHFHYDVRFLLKVTSDETIICSSESNELRWINKDGKKFPSAEPSVIRMFHKWCSL